LTAAPSPATLGSRLLEWMRASSRDLPWRRNRTPYSVWVSEVMLQQTQVATVIAYFERWMAEFPDITSLATAPLDRVLKAWEGLGYYARARNLHLAARSIVQRHNGRVPDRRSELLALPGIGRYTAGAILSIAYGQIEPVLDGNVRRVLCRVFDIAEDPRTPATEARLWDLSTALVQTAPPGLAGELNEALMELGALVCTPTSPDCLDCPIHELCLALARGTVAERPVRSTRPALPHYDTVAAIMTNGSGELLIMRRSLTGLLGGLWGFPGGAVRPGEEIGAALARIVFEQTGMTATPQQLFAQVKHAYTHFRITLHAFTAQIDGVAARPVAGAEVRWVRPSELDQFAFPVTDRKIARQLVRESPQSR